MIEEAAACSDKTTSLISFCQFDKSCSIRLQSLSRSMSYLLCITASPNGADSSFSRMLSEQYLKKYRERFPENSIKVRDLAAEPVEHLSTDCLQAAFVPEEERSESMASKHKKRLELVDEIINAASIVISSPMWNWNVPSSLKAYIDHIVFPGVLDPYGCKGLTGKPVSIIVSSGGTYQGEKAVNDFCSPYLKHIVESLGATDVEIIRTEYSLAAVVPSMAELVEAQEQSFADSQAAVDARASSVSA